jgi:hypothetical protein
MPMFRRKPSLVEAVQWTGDDQGWAAICALHADSELVAFREDDGSVSIETIGGRVAAQPGDRIIKGGVSDFTLCRAEVFAANHEPA